MLKTEMEAEIKRLEGMAVEWRKEAVGNRDTIINLDVSLCEANGEIDKLGQDIRLAGYRIEDLTTGYDSRGDERDRLKLENARLINKNEAMQSIMDSMAHLATAGQALIEL